MSRDVNEVSQLGQWWEIVNMKDQTLEQAWAFWSPLSVTAERKEHKLKEAQKKLLQKSLEIPTPIPTPTPAPTKKAFAKIKFMNILNS